MPESTLTTSPKPRAAVLRMKEYHPPLGNRNGLRLDFNENTLECSPAVLRVLREIGSSDLTRYPEREPVERLVAEHLGLAAEQVLLTNGVDEAIHVLCETYLDAGDEILLPIPTYSMYEVYASATEAKVVGVQAAADFEFPLERLLNAVTPATKLIAIANPNSPTGKTATREQILKIVEHAPQAAVLVDEAYFHFFGNTVADLIGRFPNLLLARTFSKAYGLAGLRIGMLAGDVESVRWLRRVTSPYSVNSLALACLPAALDDKEYLDWYVREVLSARAELFSALEALKVPYWTSEANFVLVKIGAKHAQFVDQMRQRGILLRDRSSDPGCNGCVRITVGTGAQMMTAVEALIESLDEIGWNATAQQEKDATT
ncbi:Histidinol-phosphate aminotransferase [Acidisarcina polymorpha]|uniref:Histidinol-phosphate aminotransferase n=1 Tax=Acidisarcina polymorpha TaxID=2211140 RepID=A0A2Z5G7X0_9BACT|nr:histidinol-phosphate transaminase [Acidisarcina polymorpha]AXC15372.1 Histidinol-phosphate aminotransferase [Acidisarcina polymorpha]